MNKKTIKRPPAEQQTPTPLLILMSLVLFLLFGFLLVWVAVKKSAEYRESPTDGYPAYRSQSTYRSPEEQYRQQLQDIQSREAQLRQQGEMDLERSRQETQEQLQLLRLQQEQLKTQKSPY